MACAPVVDAAGRLLDLLTLYAQGLEAPLPFFPETSLAWAQAARAGKGPEAARRAARPRWHDEYNQRGEALDPYVQVAFRGVDPLDGTFEALASRVFAPLLDAEAEGAGDAPP
jgi:exodeoxyribonuclease V gamma subunit